MGAKFDWRKKSAGIIIGLAYFLVIIFSQVISGYPGSGINFGYIEAQEPGIKTAFFAYQPKIEESVSLHIWGSEKVITADKQQSLPINRIHLEVKDRYLKLNSISSEPIQIQTEKHQTLVFRISINPEDQPGIYKGKIYIQEIGPEGNYRETRVFPVRIEVGPWLVIEKNFSGAFRLDRNSGTNKGVESELPGKILVKGNVPWEVHAYLQKGLPYDTSLRIEAFPHPQNLYNVQDFSETKLNKKPQKLAYGPTPSISPNNKIEIEFNLSIEDFTRVPAGNYEFPLVIIAQPLIQ